MVIGVLRRSDSDGKLVEMPMTPIERDSSCNGILMALVDLGRKATGIVAKISHPDAGTASAMRQLVDSSHSALRS